MGKQDKKTCCECIKKITKNEVGLSMKLLGRNIESFFCVDCLAAYLETTSEELQQKIEEFKAQGCTLFS